MTSPRTLRHNLVRCLTIVAVVASVLAGATTTARIWTTTRMANAARAFLAALDDKQRAKAALPFDSAARLDWHYVPRERPGLVMAEMNDTQKGAVHDLLHSALAAQGYLKTMGIVHVESILHDLESRPGAPATMRDPGRYTVTIFGKPGEGPWAWRFEGHHVSLNFCSVDEGASAFETHTPFFLGSNPERVPSGPDAGLRVLSLEEDLGRELYLSLNGDQRTKALLAGQVPNDVILGPGRDKGLGKAEGLLYADMDLAQRALLERLLREFVDDLESGAAAREWERIRKNGIEKIRFAWCGGTRTGEPHYWRVHGPHFVIEYDNTQNGANHAHTLWRDLENDFGADPLRRHLEEEHGASKR